MIAIHSSHKTDLELIREARDSSDPLTFELGRRLAKKVHPDVGENYPTFLPRHSTVAANGRGKEPLAAVG